MKDKIPEKVFELVQKMVDSGWKSTQHFMIFDKEFKLVQFHRNYGMFPLETAEYSNTGDVCAAALRAKTLASPHCHAFHLITDKTPEFEVETKAFYECLKKHAVGLWTEFSEVPGTIATMNIDDVPGDDLGRFIITLRSTKEHGTHHAFNALIQSGIPESVAFHLSLLCQFDRTTESWGRVISHGPMASPSYTNPIKLIRWVCSGNNIFQSGTSDHEWRWSYYTEDVANFQGPSLLESQEFKRTAIKHPSGWGQTDVITHDDFVETVLRIVKECT